MPAPADAGALRGLLPADVASTCERQTTDLDPGTVIFLRCVDVAADVTVYLHSFEDRPSLDSTWSRTGEPGLTGTGCDGGRFEGTYSVDAVPAGRIKCFDFVGPVVAWTIDALLASGWASTTDLSGDPVQLYDWWRTVAPVGSVGPVEVSTEDPGTAEVDAEAYFLAAGAFNSGYRALLDEPGDSFDVTDLPHVADLVRDLRSALLPFTGLAEADDMDAQLATLADSVRRFESMPASEVQGLMFLVDFQLNQYVTPAADALRRRLGLPTRDDDVYEFV